MTLALSDPSITYLLLGDAVATVTIVDNDHVPVTLSWDAPAVTVNENARRPVHDSPGHHYQEQGAGDGLHPRHCRWRRRTWGPLMAKTTPR